MKKAFVLILAVLIATPAFAQMETVFSGRITSGGYGGPMVKLGDIGGETGVWVGGKGGWIINHSFVIGGGGYGLVSENKETYILFSNRTRMISCGYGGLIMEYIITPRKIAHLTAGLLIGAGAAGHRFKDEDGDYEWDNNINADAFFALEPNLGAELNIARHIRMEIGATYLYTSGVELSDLDDDDIDGPNGYLTLKFGAF